MPTKSLIEELPKIVKQEKEEAQRIMERLNSHIYIIEVKGQGQVHNKNVRQKQLVTVEWCKKINLLRSSDRMNRTWEYVLLGENDFYSLHRNGANLTEMCELHKVSENAAKGELF